MIFLASILACGPTAAEALRDGACEKIDDSDARSACLAERGDCGTLTGNPHDECVFRSAERAGDAGKCRDAGAYADDCRLHLLSAGFSKWAPKEPLPGRDEALVEPHIIAAGLAVDDPRPWSAWYRYALGARRPIDRGTCASIPEELRREACTHTGIAMYNDLLNMARDKKLYPCDGGPLPEFLATTPDNELDALRAGRTDLCSSSR